MKILIGTAQFNNNYGIHQQNKNFNFKQKFFLIKYAKKKGIKWIDTAPNYKDAETELGNIGVRDFNIITKLPKIKNNILKKNYLLSKTEESLSKLKIKKLYGILVHDLKDINNKHREKYIKELKYLKKINLVKKVGISLYNINDLQKILKFWKPDLIQVPYNVIDRRLNNKKILKIIKKNKIEIHARSIFLQGLLIKRSKKRKLQKWNLLFNRWFSWCKKNKLKPYEAAYLFVKKNKNINKIIIGFDNISQIKKILQIKKRINNFPDLECKDKMLINAFNWS